VGGIPYLLEHESDSLLVPPDDPEEMVSAIHRILTEPGLSTRLSENAREKVARFDWAVVMPQWEKLLCEVAGAA
jgi:glycosyltransferase involved in cell wall biosynthesis